MGKTYFANRLVQRNRAPNRRILVWAPNGGFCGHHVAHPRGFYALPRLPEVSVCSIGTSDEMSRAAIALEPHGGCTLVVDEFHRWAPLGFKSEKDSPLWQILHEGRHRRVALIALSQRPYNVSQEFRGVIWRWVIFHLGDPADLSCVKQACGREVADKAYRLQPRQWILWETDRGLLSA
jgi:hypothetical protein